MSRTCSFTGHREIADSFKTEQLIRIEIERLINLGVTRYLCGMAIGFDSLCAKVLLSMTSTNNKLELVAVMPCKEQDKYWNESQKLIYDVFLELCDEKIYISEHYNNWCMHKRNRYLIDNSDCCIAYLTPDKTSGGTFSTVKYAEKKGVQVINIFN